MRDSRKTTLETKLPRIRDPKDTDDWQEMKDLEFEPEALDESFEQALGDEPAREPGHRRISVSKPEIASEELEQAAGDVPVKVHKP